MIKEIIDYAPKYGAILTDSYKIFLEEEIGKLNKYKFIVEEFQTHIDSFRNALENSERESKACLDFDNVSYWQHEIKALEDIENLIKKLEQNTMKQINHQEEYVQ